MHLFKMALNISIIILIRTKFTLQTCCNLPNSIQVIPKDQTSTFPSYWPSSIARITSGAILGGDKNHF